MLVQIGPRTARGDVVDLLLECHGRIRRFMSFAGQLAATRAPLADVKTVAGQVRRYFAVAFPLHLADEEELVAPALERAGGELAAALAEMRRDHVAHERAVDQLVGLCAAIERDPRVLNDLADQLAISAAELNRALEAHLVVEERVIFPAVRALPASERAAIHRGMRSRRERAW